jgi:hypothetical protein
MNTEWNATGEVNLFFKNLIRAFLDYYPGVKRNCTSGLLGKKYLIKMKE